MNLSGTRRFPPAAIVAITSFSFACLAFVLTVAVVIPATAAVGAVFEVPAAVPEMLILAELVVVPIAAAVFGVDVGAKLAGVAKEEDE